MKTIPLMCLILCSVVILCTGCITSDSSSGSAGPVIPASGKEPGPDNHPPASTDIRWISVNPVGDHVRGEHFRINGTTNLPAGEPLMVTISSSNRYLYGQYRGGWPENCSRDTGVLGIALETNVSESHDRENVWSLYVNSSDLCPDPYGIEVFAAGNTSVSTATTFILR